LFASRLIECRFFFAREFFKVFFRILAQFFAKAGLFNGIFVF